MLWWQCCVSQGATSLTIIRPMDRAELRLHLERLDAAVPVLRASSPDLRHFWQAFASMAAAIESKAATSEDAQFVGRRPRKSCLGMGLRTSANQGEGKEPLDACTKCDVIDPQKRMNLVRVL